MNMKSLIVYSSQSGNTQKLAQAVYESLPAAKEMYAVADAPDPEGYDFIALGFWFQAGRPDPKSAEYLGRIGKKPLFLFATHGASADSDHALEGMKHAGSLAPEADLIGSFNCQGEVNPKVVEKAKSKPVPPVWIDDAPNASGHPDGADIELLKYRISELSDMIN
jgi:flavodoxin